MKGLERDRAVLGVVDKILLEGVEGWRFVGEDDFQAVFTPQAMQILPATLIVSRSH